MFAKVDADGSGEIDYKEFMRLIGYAPTPLAVAPPKDDKNLRVNVEHKKNGIESYTKLVWVNNFLIFDINIHHDPSSF